MARHNFAPVAPDEEIVHGACRPGRHSDQPNQHVDAWVQAMRDHGIERVCCLLDGKLRLYDDLLEQYAAEFGADAVCHASIEDFSVVSEATLEETIWPFLTAADRADSPVIVHCSAGMGRTGQILVLWLAAERGYALEDAIRTVRQPDGRHSRQRRGASCALGWL